MSLITVGFIFKQLRPLKCLQRSIEIAASGDITNYIAEKYIKTEKIQIIVQEIIEESRQTATVVQSNKQLMDGQNQSVKRTESSFKENAQFTDQMSQSIKELTSELSEMLAHKDQVLFLSKVFQPYLKRPLLPLSK